ncbi:MAG: tRNA-binding protein [SAR116 cluster bacterium MED-G04]|jgi:tRNA-binding protein|nr:MAG: tRNA-binding protein [SAR116 cluster bacterium MED-G04]|tara:strand:+ start:3278 stop:3616 length:339 start_codon:yes stop_codon:yes gene_type:complete
MTEASFDDFMKIDIRLGTITAVEDFPEARKPAWKLTIDFGEAIGSKRSSAQITDHYGKDDLIGRQVMAVVNFPPRQIGPFMSEVLTLGVADDNGSIVLIGPDHPAPNGSRMH